MDHNDLAQFLDRRLSEEEHGRALAHLADSDDDAELLGDAAYLLRDLEGQDGVTVDEDEDGGHPHTDDADTGTDPKVVPLRPPSTARTHPRRLPARWLALAAVLAGVLLVPLALSRSGSRQPGDFASLLASRDAGLPDTSWLGRPRWGITRGGETVATDNGLAARLGALQVDLEVAAAAGQTEDTRLIVDDIAKRLDNVAGSGAVVAAYKDIGRRADEPAEALAAPLADARENLALFMNEDYFNLGAWAEAASIAVRRRDAAFFHAGASREMLDRWASLPSLDDKTRATVEAIRAATKVDPLNWTLLETQTGTLLRSVADVRT
jgi:hypothetical protein